jgi:hypothetical protein
LGFHPFYNKVSQDLRLDHISRDVANVEFVELEGPLSDASERVTMADDFAERSRGHY